jgi:type III restriction enzyme
MVSRKVTVAQLARLKYSLRGAVEEKISQLRGAHRREAYQAFLFGPQTAIVEVDPAFCFEFDADRYAPSWYYDGRYRFKRHYVGPIGELKGEGEEYECAVRLDQMDEVETWIRNLDSRPETSFWLQTSTDRFYPDFVARLRDGRIFVVEYKGEDRWSNDDSKEKRALGELWAERSGGRRLFLMPKGPDWYAITACVRTSRGNR